MNLTIDPLAIIAMLTWIYTARQCHRGINSLTNPLAQIAAFKRAQWAALATTLIAVLEIRHILQA